MTVEDDRRATLPSHKSELAEPPSLSTRVADVVAAALEPGCNRDVAVDALLIVFEALVETERIAADALAAAAAARADTVRDHLTGLLNRRGWEQALEQEQSRGQRRLSPAVIAVIDIDHLKRTNDVGGHLAGDLLLRLAADTIAASVRSNDIVARIGGDEFAVLGLDYADPLPATFVDRLQCGLDSAGVAASVGAAVHEAKGPLKHTFRLADSAMYDEKQGRRTFDAP